MKRCGTCGFDNTAAMRFCGGCGTRLPATCASCGFENPATFKFCGSCGEGLTSAAPGAPAVPTQPSVPTAPADSGPASARGTTPATTMPEFRLDRTDGERRQLTVLFCDLVDSTALAERLDAEVYRDLVREYQRTCEEVIARYDGHIAQYLGDGLLVYFGYPQAHEDDARRAGLAALGILDAMRELNVRTHHATGASSLSVRIGIHTGSVVAGEVGSGQTRERLALGSTPNIAARLQSIAQPDGILLSGETHRLLHGWFDLESLGAKELRGVSRTVLVYRVLREARRNGRFELDDARRLSPLVGRDEELGLLTRRLSATRDGNGFIVLLSGEAGVGKSRLVQAARVRAQEEGFTCVVGRSAAVHQNSALLPVADLLEGMIGFEDQLPGDERLQLIESFVDELALERNECVPLIAPLLSTQLSSAYTPILVEPHIQKQRTLDTVVQVLVRAAERKPLVVVMEDLHWADPSTLEFLTLLVEQPPVPGLLTIFTVRPDFSVPWRSRSHVSHLTLSRLSDQDVRALITQMAGDQKLPLALITQVVQKTDGIPVFVEELTRMMLELGVVEGGAPVDPASLAHLMEVPETLQDSLLARLDRLGDAKDIAQVGAVLGRTFGYDLILAVSQYDETTLRQQLTRLVDAELLYQRGVAPHSTYTFKHALIQEAAYALLLRSTRRVLHDRVATVIETQFAMLAEQQPELVAHHLAEAGRKDDAVKAWTRAGMRAMERSALIEAMSQLKRALTLIESMPVNPKRDALELRTLTTLATAYSSTRGYAAPETIDAYARANQICERMGDAKELFWVIVGLWVSTYVSGNLRKAFELAERLMRISQNEQRELRMEALYCMGASHRFLGNLGPARDHLHAVLALDYPNRIQHSRVYTALDIVTTSASLASECAWLLGDVAEAIRLRDFALSESARINHPFSVAVAEIGACWLGAADGDRNVVLHHGTRTLELSERYGLFVAPVAAAYLGWARNDPGAIASSLQMFLMGGSKLGTTQFFSLLAEAHWRTGNGAAALEALDDADRMMVENGEEYWDAQLAILHADILRGGGQFDEAEANLQLAVLRAESRGVPILLERAKRSLRELAQVRTATG
ncbi:MAG: AAA family ATPase [Phycisphaerae bacterium]|nr:AAA family ATPase [Gemmatimonadaceae bacterium]